MAKKTPLLKILELTAIVDAQLHQFEPMDDESDYSQVSPPEKKKRNPLLRAAVAGGAMAGAVAIGTNKDKIKAGYQTQKAAATEAGRLAMFRGMRKTAEGINKAGNFVNRTSKKGPDMLREPGLKAGAKIKKVAKKLRKKSMQFFNADMVEALKRIDAKVRYFERA